MKTYEISTRALKQTIRAKNETEARIIFWENFDCYNEQYPDGEDLIVEVVKPKKKIDTSNADHPARQIAIQIIEQVIEPYVKHGIRGQTYYDLEDKITLLVAGT